VYLFLLNGALILEPKIKNQSDLWTAYSYFSSFSLNLESNTKVCCGFSSTSLKLYSLSFMESSGSGISKLRSPFRLAGKSVSH